MLGVMRVTLESKPRINTHELTRFYKLARFRREYSYLVSTNLVVVAAGTRGRHTSYFCWRLVVRCLVLLLKISINTSSKLVRGGVTGLKYVLFSNLSTQMNITSHVNSVNCKELTKCIKFNSNILLELLTLKAW